MQLNEAIFCDILEAMLDAIVIIDCCEQMTLANAKIEELFGYNWDELVGQSIELLLPAYKQEIGIQRNSGNSSYGHLRKMHAHFEVTGQYKEGPTFPVAIRLSPLELEDGLHIVCVIRDISDYKQVEKQTIEADRLATLGKFLAVLAHEMNNPIQIIEGHLDLILNFQLDAEEVERYLRLIRNDLEHIKNISWRVLNYASPQPGIRQRVMIAELLGKALVFVEKRLEKNNIMVVLDLQEVPPVMAAQSQLMQVFLNLIVNAIEALISGGAHHIKLRSVMDQAEISFMSDGPPIPKNVLPHIFEPFFTTKEDGNGLGLWVSHRLVQQHGGSLTARNLSNQEGVVFTVKLPIQSDSE